MESKKLPPILIEELTPLLANISEVTKSNILSRVSDHFRAIDIQIEHYETELKGVEIEISTLEQEVTFLRNNGKRNEVPPVKAKLSAQRNLRNTYVQFIAGLKDLKGDI